MRFEEFLNCVKEDVQNSNRLQYVVVKDMHTGGRPLIRFTLDDGTGIKKTLADVGYFEVESGRYSRYVNIYSTNGTTTITNSRGMSTHLANHLGKYAVLPRLTNYLRLNVYQGV